MSWKSVPICEDCWILEEGMRKPVRVNTLDLEICYRCNQGTRGGIFVRREVNDSASDAI